MMDDKSYLNHFVILFKKVNVTLVVEKLALTLDMNFQGTISQITWPLLPNLDRQTSFTSGRYFWGVAE